MCRLCLTMILRFSNVLSMFALKVQAQWRRAGGAPAGQSKVARRFDIAAAEEASSGGLRAEMRGAIGWAEEAVDGEPDEWAPGELAAEDGVGHLDEGRARREGPVAEIEGELGCESNLLTTAR
jgi:hypothetical protein